MASFPLQQAVSSRRQAPQENARAGVAAPARSAHIGKGLAAFLLGLMLGVTGILLGQSAFHDGAADGVSTELRR